MKIQQLIEEIESSVINIVMHEHSDLDKLLCLLHPYTRKLIEAVGEELINLNNSVTQADQRLKLKEILSSISK